MIRSGPQFDTRPTSMADIATPMSPPPVGGKWYLPSPEAASRCGPANEATLSLRCPRTPHFPCSPQSRQHRLIAPPWPQGPRGPPWTKKERPSWCGCTAPDCDSPRALASWSPPRRAKHAVRECRSETPRSRAVCAVGVLCHQMRRITCDV